jgi:hypothetical protein
MILAAAAEQSHVADGGSVLRKVGLCRNLEVAAPDARSVRRATLFCHILEVPLTRSSSMLQYLIERELPGAGKLSAAELKKISQKSCGVLKQMGSQIQWVHSYVTGDKIYCVYRAANEEMVREHARQGGFPANRVSQVTSMIDPTTAE